MGIKKIVLMILFIMMGLAHVEATPPTNVTLTYDVEKKMLHVSAKHATESLDRHYLRRVVIYKNDQEVDAVNLTRQKMPSGIEEDIALEAQQGDRIAVSIYCKKGGEGKGEMTVTVVPMDAETK